MIEKISRVDGRTIAIKRDNRVNGALVDLFTRYSFDVLGRLAAVLDPNNNATTATYDSLNRMITLTNPDTGLSEFQYTLAGDLGARITPNLRANTQKIRYKYQFHRPSRIEYPQSGNVIYTYGGPGAAHNGAGRLTELTDSSGIQLFEYGAAGELTRVERTLNAFGGYGDSNTVMSFNYDSGGRIHDMTYPDGEVVTYGYNHGGMLQSVNGNRNGAFTNYVNTVRYDHFGRSTSIDYGNGTLTRFNYDSTTQRLSQLNTTTPLGTPLQRLNYTYNDGGIITAIADNIPTGPGNVTRRMQTFGYDRLNQLQASSGSYVDAQGNENRYKLSMEFDALGNVSRMNQRNTFVRAVGGTSVIAANTRNNAYMYNAGHPHQAAQIGSRSYTFDANGNQVESHDVNQGAPRELSWDEEDRLVSVKENGLTTGFLYDAGGTRTHKAGSGGATYYPSAYVTLRNGTQMTKHIFAGSHRVATVIAPAQDVPGNGQTYWYHADHAGTVQYTTDELGAVHEHAETLPFGESWVEEASAVDRTPYRFAGRERDSETGLTYVGARYYEAKTAQWLSADPALPEYMLGGGVGNVLNLSLYAYAWNSPVSFADLDGRQASSIPQPMDGGSGSTAPSPMEVRDAAAPVADAAPPSGPVAQQPGVPANVTAQANRIAATDFVEFSRDTTKQRGTRLPAAVAQQRLAEVRRGAGLAAPSDPIAAENLANYVSPSNHGQGVRRDIQPLLIQATRDAVQRRVDSILAAITTRASRGIGTDGLVLDQAQELRSTGQGLAPNGPNATAAERNVYFGYGYYAVAVRAIVYRPSSAPNTLRILSWQVQIGDFYNFDKGSVDIYGFTPEMRRQIAGVLPFAQLFPGFATLTRLGPFPRLTMDDAFFDSLRASGVAANFDIRTNIIPLGNLGNAPNFVRLIP